MYQEALEITFLLKIGEQFWSERAIGEQLAALLSNDMRRKIDVTWPDGAISIRYWDRQLLGEACWDYLMDIVSAVRSVLPGLLSGRQGRIVFQLSGCVLTLVPRGDRLAFELTSGAAPAERHVLPLRQFVHDFELMYWRLEKTRATLGGGSYGTGLQQWRGQVDSELGDVVDAAEIAAIIDQPLDLVLGMSAPADGAEPDA